jgi:hypothetical protein
MRGRHAAYSMAMAAVLAAAALAQTQVPAAPPTPAPVVPPLTPAQQAAVILGNWETCIDLSAQFLAYSTLGPKRSTANVIRKCAYFEAQVRPVLAQSLREMMYGSSEAQVAAQAEVAVEALRRHVSARATAAVARVRAK